MVFGVMPIFSVKMMENLSGISGATATDEIKAGIPALPEGDRDLLVDFGIEFALRQWKEQIAEGVVRPHICTMDRGKSGVAIVKRPRDASATRHALAVTL